MVAGGDRVETGVARRDRLLDALPEPGHRVFRARLLRADEHAEFHGGLASVVVPAYGKTSPASIPAADQKLSPGRKPGPTLNRTAGRLEGPGSRRDNKPKSPG